MTQKVKILITTAKLRTLFDDQKDIGQKAYMFSLKLLVILYKNWNINNYSLIHTKFKNY